MADGYCKRQVALLARDSLITHAPMIDSVYDVISVYTQFCMNDGFKPVIGIADRSQSLNVFAEGEESFCSVFCKNLLH